MSTMGGGGTESLGDLEIDVSLNTAPAQQQAAVLMGKIQQTGQTASGTAASGFRAFGSAGVSAIGGIIGQANTLNRSFGTTSPLAPLMSSLTMVQAPLSQFGAYLDADTQKMSAMRAVAGGMVGIGAVFVGIAGAVSQLSAPLQDANAALTTSIANTKNALTGVPDSISNYTEQIKQADATSAHFGYSSDQVNQALSQLTEETRSAPEAFKELTFTETVAAASHTNLANAASLVGRMHAGLFRSLRRFGIDIPSLLSNPAHEAAKAENELASATDHLQRAQTNLNDFEEKMAAAEQSRQAKFQAAVTSAQQAATNAQNAYQTSLQRTADAEQKSADASQKAQQTISDNASKLAQDTQNAADAVANAQGKIQSLQDQWAAQDSTRAQAAQDKIQQTSDALQAAQENLSSMTAEWTLTPARTAAEQLSKLDQMRKAAEQLKKAQDAAQAATAAPQGVSAADQVTRQRELASAQDQLNKAIQRQNQLGEEAAKMQMQNRQAQIAANTALEGYARAQQQQAQAQVRVSDANDKLAKSQAELAAAASPTLAESQQLAKLHDQVTEAQEQMAKAKQDQKAAGQDQQRLDNQFQLAMGQFMSRESGLLTQRSQTWAGHLRSWSAGIKNVIMEVGQFAGPMATAGMAFMGIGGLVRGIGSIRDLLGRLKQADENPVEKTTLGLQGLEAEAETSSDKAGQLAMDFEGLGSSVGRGADEVEQGTHKIAGIGQDLGKAKTAAGDAERVIGESGHFGKIGASAAGLVGKVGGAMSGVGSAVMGLGPVLMGPIGIVIAAIAGLALIGFIVYKNWDTITKDLSKAWNWIFGEGKRLFGDFESFIKRWGAYILLPIAPFIAIPLIIYQNWGKISGFFGKILGDILGFFEALPGEAYNMIHSLMWTFLNIGLDIVKGIWQGLSNAGGWLYDQVTHFVKSFIESPIKSFFGLFSPSRKMAEHGDNIARGLAQGLLGGGPLVKAAADRLAQQANLSLQGVGVGIGGGVFGRPGAGISPAMQPTHLTANFTVNIPVEGNVVTDLELKNSIKSFFQQGATQNGGLSRFLGVPGSSY